MKTEKQDMAELADETRTRPAEAAARDDIDALLSADGDFVAACERYQSDADPLLGQCLAALMPIHEVGAPLFGAVLAVPAILAGAPPCVPALPAAVAQSVSRVAEEALGLALGSVKTATLAVPLGFVQQRLTPSALVQHVWNDTIPALLPERHGAAQPYLLPMAIVLKAEELALLQRGRREFFTTPTAELGRLRAFLGEHLERESALPRGSVSAFMPLFFPWAAAALRRFTLNAALKALQPASGEQLAGRLRQNGLTVALFGLHRAEPVVAGLAWHGETDADAAEALGAASKRFGLGEPALL
jgi:hypothetical protein